MWKYCLLLVLNLPLIAEVVRKYAIQSDLVFFAGDLLALLAFLALLMRGELRGRLPVTFYALVATVTLWIFVHQLISNRDIGVLGVGARAMLLPIVYLCLSASFMSKYRDALRLLFVSATVWVCIAGAMAVTQIYLGRDHPINAVWGDQWLGIGDYGGVKQTELVDGLFRPTSVFTHTGKFGQVAFLLVLFRWSVYAFGNLKLGKIGHLFILVDLITIAASGQRAAFVFLAVSALGLAWYAGRIRGKSLGKLLTGVVGVVALTAIFIAMFPKYGAAVQSRFESGFLDIPERLQGNLILPIGSVLKDHLIVGEGFGYFTLGAQRFGGKIAYESLDLAGLGESSLIRVCGEIGFVGALLFIGIFLSIYLKAIRASIVPAGASVNASTIFYVFWIASLLLWSNTADVFGNTVGTFMGYALSGAALLADGELKLRSRAYGTYANLLGHPRAALAAGRGIDMQSVDKRIG